LHQRRSIWWIGTDVKDVALEESAQRLEAAAGKWHFPM